MNFQVSPEDLKWLKRKVSFLVIWSAIEPPYDPTDPPQKDDRRHPFTIMNRVGDRDDGEMCRSELGAVWSFVDINANAVSKSSWRYQKATCAAVGIKS